jgi:hypothetical protein
MAQNMAIAKGRKVISWWAMMVSWRGLRLAGRASDYQKK